MSTSDYYYRYIEKEKMRFYSLNYFFAKLHKKDVGECDGEMPVMKAYYEKLANKNLIVGGFYKNVSTICDIEESYE
jgi:hypothetical protein